MLKKKTVSNAKNSKKRGKKTYLTTEKLTI